MMSKQIKTESGEVSDEDSISITSTAPSEPREEYPVEAIIAEREVDGAAEYLVRWEGYPDERCTWEPESSFQSDDTLFDWKTQKMRFSQGIATPCNIEALLDRVENWITASEHRKDRRRMKRMRLGIPVTPIETDVDDEIRNDRRQTIAGKEVQTGFSQALSSKGTLSKKETNSAKSQRSSEQTDGRHNTSKERPQVFKGHEEKAAINVVRNAPTAVMFHPQRQEDQSSNHPISTAHASLESPIKSSAGNFRKATDAVKNLPPIRDSHPELHPQRQEIQSPIHHRSTSKSSTESPFKSSVGPVRKTTDFAQKLPTTRDSLSERESSITNPRSSLPSTLPPKPIIDMYRRGAVTNSRSGMVWPVSPSKDTHAPKQAQMGSSGRGPARLHPSNIQPGPTSSKRPSVTGAALLNNWNKSVKPRKSLAYQRTLPKPNERAQEKFGKLSVKRKYEKAGRNEPAPDIDKLVFMDLKKPPAKKSALSLPGLKIPSKTPFEMIQESLNESHTNESVIVETPTSNTSDAIAEQSSSNANGSVESKAMSIETSTPDRAHGPSQVDTTGMPSENVSLPLTTSPRKRPSLPFQAYRQQATSSLSAGPSNIVPPSSGPQATKTASSEKPLELQELPTLLQPSYDSEPQPATPVIAGMSHDQKAENSDIQTVNDPKAKASESSPSTIPPISRNEPNLSTEAPVPDLHKSPQNEIDPSSAICIFNALPGLSRNEPELSTEAPASDLHKSPEDKINPSAISISNAPQGSSRNEPNLSTEAPAPVLDNSPENEINPSSAISIPNAPPRSSNEPTSPTQAVRSNSSRQKFNEVKAEARLISFDLTEAEEHFASSSTKDDVIGTLIVGPEHRDLGEIRFRTLDFPSKKLMLNIKVYPRQMHFWFQQICTADDYRAYYHTVSHRLHPFSASSKGSQVDWSLAPL